MTFTTDAIDRLVEIMRGKNVKEARQAAVAILDRACGKPSQPLTDGEGGPLIPAQKMAALEALRAVMPRAPVAAAASDPPPAPPEQPAGA